jgi:predicted flap endonuclease-1-like 5' DNA nuclease
MPSIIDIEGIGPQYAKKLSEISIKTTEALLKQGATPKGRKIIDEKTQIGHKLILEWVNLADLFRIKGVGEEYSDLLEEAGIDTVVGLSNRNAENLFAKVNEVNKEKKLVRRPPALSMVKSWVEQAKKLKRVIEY